jgi:hypothetical protein
LREAEILLSNEDEKGCVSVGANSEDAHRCHPSLTGDAPHAENRFHSLAAPGAKGGSATADAEAQSAAAAISCHPGAQVGPQHEMAKVISGLQGFLMPELAVEQSPMLPN